MRFRCVLLNALPLNSFPDEFEEFSIVVRKISIDVLTISIYSFYIWIVLLIFMKAYKLAKQYTSIRWVT